MANVRQESTHEADRGDTGAGRLAYVIPAEAVEIGRDDAVDLMEVWRVLWNSRALILTFAAVLVAVGVTYALLATKWYRAETLLVPADVDATRGLLEQLGGLGGLASIAGFDVGEADTAEPLAVLRSREFTRAFIVDNDLLPILFSDEWDAKAQAWKAREAEDQPDLYDAVKYFDEEIRSVREDSKTGLVTVVVEWTDPKLAAAWANSLVSRLNERMRRRSLQETEARVNYLKRELASTSMVALQESIGRLLESELQKAMIARVNDEFAFRIVDRAETPKWRSWPKRSLIVGFTLIAGLLLPSLAALARNAIRKRRNRGTAAERSDLGR